MSSEPDSVWRRRLTGAGDPLSRRAGIFFMIGSTCFALGAFPPYFDNLPGQVVGVTFFVGSVFFTSAGLTQLLQLRRDPPGDRKVLWAVVVQLLGMVFFNINTFRAAFLSVPADQVNELIWAPDFFGSIAFLVASHLAWLAVCGGLWCVDRANAEWWMAALNYVGSISFMLSALAAFTLPTTGDVVNIGLVNLGTFVGAVCFFLGAYLLLPVGRSRVAQG
ncbi:MAG: hypothetical protein WAL25_09665 [Acidimicrobiia bacterium]